MIYSTAVCYQEAPYLSTSGVTCAFVLGKGHVMEQVTMLGDSSGDNSWLKQIFQLNPILLFIYLNSFEICIFPEL